MEIKGNTISCNSYEDFKKNRRKILKYLCKQNENPFQRFKPTLNFPGYIVAVTFTFCIPFTGGLLLHLLSMCLFLAGIIASYIGMEAYEEHEVLNKQYK